LASTSTAIYEACPVLRADVDEQRDSRLALCDQPRRSLSLGLSLLGMAAPERM
jgi:arginyl-tRNA synthetase